MTQERIIQLKQRLEDSKNVDICEVDTNSVLDINDIKIGRKKSSEDRIIDFLENVDNPYLFKVDGVLVKIEFSNNNKRAEECISNVLNVLYK